MPGRLLCQALLFVSAANNYLLILVFERTTAERTTTSAKIINVTIIFLPL